MHVSLNKFLYSHCKIICYSALHCHFSQTNPGDVFKKVWHLLEKIITILLRVCYVIILEVTKLSSFNFYCLDSGKVNV
ncbi:hypothetical protein ZIOFF_066991 [Zingiber officinale]|uniref:Uncharacterized protein n=1 Tax=Zingiber officinale TaxID=94328 RepID=A0A8J5CEU4_ZINOF|nr:hypothetical protein ZIOFF_066991 [Zingiber officinale]